MTIKTDHPATNEILSLGDRLTRPRRVMLALDAIFVAIAIAVFGQAADPDILFHVMWVVLALQAFLFGLRVSALRIAIAIGLLAIYVNLDAMNGPDGAPIAELDLAEWPLMIVIAWLVAVMADRVTSTSRRYAELYRRASDRLMTAQEDERKRLGRDLHDGVGQTLTAVVFTLDAAESMLWAGEESPSVMARSALRRAQELAATALDETRDVAYRLRPARFAETGLVASVSRLAASAGALVTVNATADLAVPGLLDPEDEMNVYRIVQESIGNAVRHAQARTIRVDFARTDSTLLVDIVDDGIGFEPKSTEDRGLGLTGMHERSIIIRSGLEVASSPGGGTRVSLRVPIPKRSLPTPSSADRLLHGGLS